jgi:hypothetical protein
MKTTWTSDNDNNIIDVILNKDEYVLENDIYYYNLKRVEDVATIIAEQYMESPVLKLFVDEPQEIEGTTDVVVSLYYEER